MSLHADVAVPARDRRRLERLARYILRSPICLDRLEAQPGGRLSYKLKIPWRDGTTHILMGRHELLERLAPLIPPPRAHQVRYFGILAPSASGRDRVVPGARQAAAAASASSSDGSATLTDVLAGSSGGALGGRPMHSRMRFATVGSVIAAITRIERPHSHRRAVTPNTRFNKSAHGRCRGRTEGTGRGVTFCGFGPGAISA
jgi:hypothetical protein